MRNDSAEEIMAPRLLRWGTPVVAAILLMVVRGPLMAQGAQGSPDILASLLTEVRGLRAAMEQMAAAGPRVQLAMGRLQMQEQRVNTALRKLDDVRERRTEAEREVVQLRTQLAQAQENVGRVSADTPEWQTIDSQMKMIKEAVAIRSSEIQRLVADEAEAAGALASEQGRWSEINQRLEDLERALARQ
jgi:chromosome segregation ATPase